MFLILSVLSLFPSVPPGSPVSWVFSSSAGADGHVNIVLTAKVEEGWHIYATALPADDGPIATSIRFKPSEGYTLHGALHGPEPEEVYDPNFGMMVRYHDGSPVFIQAIVPLARNAFEVEGEVEYMVCSDRTCLPPKTVPFRITVTPAGAKWSGQ